MIKCPACGAQIDSDFGMISCPACSAVFMVEMDGSIQDLGSVESFSEAPNEVVESTSEATIVEPTVVEPVLAEPEIVEDPFQTHEIVEPEALEEPVAMEPYEAESIADGYVAPSEESYGEAEPAETIYTENFMDQMDVVTKEPDPNDPLGVTAFDQSAASQMPDGLYYYDVKIAGLDSAQIRENVIDALSDPRFDWTPDDIKKSISNGELILKNLNPVKAVLAVIKLQPLDVEVEWTQKPYTDESVDVEQDVEI